MPKEITVTLYSFKELLEGTNKQAAEKARQWLQDQNTYDGWAETVMEEWKNEFLNAIGFERADICWTGFSNQGDGSSFTAQINLTKVIEFFTATITPTQGVNGDKPQDYYNFVAYQLGYREPVILGNNNYKAILPQTTDFTVSIYRSCHRYCHENSCKIESFNNMHEKTPDYEKVTVQFNDLMIKLEELRYNLSKIIYQQLEAEYTHATSDEALLELAEANDFQFMADGTHFKG